MLSITLLSALLYSSHALAAPAQLVQRTPPGNKPVIIQMFEWSWNSVAQECTNFIGPAGYGFVQVSPAQEMITGNQWWTSYQAVSYTIQNRRGTRDEYSAMVTACNNAGVQVIADTILNHMAGIDSGTGVDGNSFTHYDYPGTYSGYDFHYCGTSGNDIQDWSNKTQIQFCELSNLADLATETEYVRSRLAEHANDLLSLGVAGFRVDAAKHIPLTDLQNIISRLSRTPYITSEVIGGGEPIPPSDYAGLGDVTVSDYSVRLETAFKTDGISGLNGFESQFNVPSGSASVFVASHDSERGNNGGSLNFNDGAIYTLANVFALAYPYGTPTVISSYYFSSADDGAPNNGYGTCDGNAGTNGFVCEHRWTAIAGLTQFRNTVGSAELNNWQSGSNMQVAFGRGSAGFVVINNADSAWSNTFQTSLADGSYCDVASGSKSGSSCSGQTITVSGGSFQISVAARTAVAIHTGAKL